MVKANRTKQSWEEKIDEILVLETTDMTTPCEGIVERYKELAEIERGWRAMKSTLELRPVYHWTEKRIWRMYFFVLFLCN